MHMKLGQSIVPASSKFASMDTVADGLANRSSKPKDCASSGVVGHDPQAYFQCETVEPVADRYPTMVVAGF